MPGRKNTITEKPLISISIPLFNEEKNIPILYSRLTRLADKIEERYNLEFVFSDNHSDDSTWEILAQLAEQDTRIKALAFIKTLAFNVLFWPTLCILKAMLSCNLMRLARSTRNVGGIFKRGSGDVSLSWG